MADSVARFAKRSRRSALFFEALSGIRPAFHLLPEHSFIPADTDTTVRLPESVDLGEDVESSWRWYRTALAFRSLRYDPKWGTFVRSDGSAGLGDREDPGGRERVSRALSVLPNPALGRMILEVLDGARLDGLLRRSIPGLAPTLAKVHGLEAQGIRSGLGQLDPRSQLLQALLLASLIEQEEQVSLSPAVAAALPEAIDALASVLGLCGVPAALAATDVVYDLVVALPPLDDGSRTSFLLARPMPKPSLESSASSRTAVGPAVRLEGMQRYGIEVPVLAYRGAVGTRDLDHRDTGRFRSSALIAWREGVDDDHHHPAHGGPAQDHADDEAEDSGPPEPIPHEHGEVSRWEVPHLPLVSESGVDVAFYPEWDGFAGAYLPAHCRVVEESLARDGDSDFLARALAVHRSKVVALLREWVRLPAEGLKLQRRLLDGDEVDVHAAVELTVDRRAGAAIDDRVYQRKVPVERDVATMILVDASMSTADRIEASETEDFRIDEEALALYGRPHRTVLDREREAALLLSEMLSRAGDLSAVLAFSSTGRELVRVQRLKGFDEPISRAAGARFAALRPLDATRLAAAVRHATASLRRVAVRSRYLLVMTDGLPYDDDYGDDYGDGQYAYAVQDTVRALDEAQLAGIRARVLITDPDVDPGLVAEFGDRAKVLSSFEDLASAVSQQYVQLRAQRWRGPNNRS